MPDQYQNSNMILHLYSRILEFITNKYRFKNYQSQFPYLTILLLLLPLLFIIIWFNFRYQSGSYYYTMFDPSYTYLLNGITILENNFKVDYIDHPGTPLHLLIACIAKTLSFFRGTELVEDVLKNPELYLQTTNVVINIIVFFFLFFFGYIIYKKTNDIFLALLFQTIPFNYDLLFLINHVMSDTLAFVFMILLVFLLIIYTSNFKTNKRYYILFAFTCSLILATKISAIPIIIVPFLALNSWKKRGRFVILTLLLFFVFAYPVLFEFSRFYNWIVSILIHTDKYGGGKATIIEKAHFIQNCKLLINKYSLVYWLSIADIIILLFSIFRKKLKKVSDDPVLLNILLGILLAVLFQTFLVSKHFGWKYFLPAKMLMVLNLYIIILYIHKNFKFRYIKYLSNLYYLLIITFILVHTYKYTSSSTYFFSFYKEQREITSHVIQSYPSNGAIVHFPVLNSPYKERALWFGEVFQRKYCLLFADKLDSIYNDQLFFNRSDRIYMDYKFNKYTFSDILWLYDTLYFIDNDQTLDIDDLIDMTIYKDSLNIREYYTNEILDEHFYKVYRNENTNK